MMSHSRTQKLAGNGETGAAPVANRQINIELNDVVPRRYPLRWITVLILIVLAAQLFISIASNPNFHWNVFSEYLLSYHVIRGVGYTLLLTVLAMALATVIAVFLVVMRDSSNPIMRTGSWLWIWFFRGTPVYTQLLFWGLFAVLFPRISISIPFGPEIIGVQSKLIVTPAVAAIIGLGFCESSYLSEVFRAGFNSIGRGQTEAAQAIGMRKSRIWIRILMPQAMRVIIPPTGNSTIGMLKMTSLVLAVPFTLDLMFSTNAIGNRLYLPVPLLMVAGFWYLTITSVLMVGQYYLEKHFGKGIDNIATGAT